ncbi:MAG: arsenate reductase [Pseudomonadota bacterium]
MTVTLFGLKTCDTCRKARKELESAGIEYEYVDVRADGVPPQQLSTWADAAGWQALLNTRSTTWRGLSDGERRDVGETEALALMSAHPTLIKRPVIEADGVVLVGWSTAAKTALGL